MTPHELHGPLANSYIYAIMFYESANYKKVAIVLLALALLVLLLAVGGGIAINPLLFVLVILAVVLAVGSTRRGPAL